MRYIPGLRNLLADCLSRLGDQKDTIKLPKLHVYQISHQLPARRDRLHELRQATQADDELALLKHTIMSGWPSTIKEILQVLNPYWTFREELTIEDGLILKGTRIVVLSKQWETILNQIHDSHLGLQKCKLHAMQSVYWPGINDQLKQLVLNCQLCLRYSRSWEETRNKLIIRTRNSIIPMDKISNRYISFWRGSIPSTCWLHKSLPILCKLKSMTAQHIADIIKQIFAEYGGPTQ